MCGIAGVIVRRDYNQRNIKDILNHASAVQLHRGPDRQGIAQFSLHNWQLGLGHQRLAILDLSEAGNQPMLAKDGSCLIYNGEVYNYKEIRSELESLGYHFQSKTDTEVVLAALREWGPAQAFSRFNGMWSLAWLDQANSRLILARDRMGVKPLYYFCLEDKLYFASEIKTILEMVPQKFKLNYQAVGEYLTQYLMETTTNTFFKDILKVPAANYCSIDLAEKALKLKMQSYWTIPTDVERPLAEGELIEQLRATFFDSVRLRLRSDVPVGVLLSGGIDSSAIAAAVHHELGPTTELNLFSAVSKDRRYDESAFIDLVGGHLNRKTHKVCLDLEPQQVFTYLEQVSWFNDEPVGSLAYIAYFLMMQKAKQLGITVILSGQGADELLCGYKKYFAFYIQSLLNRNNYLEAAQVAGSLWRQGTVLKQFSLSEAKRYLPRFLCPEEPDVRGENLLGFNPVQVGLGRKMSVQERQALDVQNFSVPILTHFEDRMSMAWSREVRLPFLDYRLVELLVSLPTEVKLHNGWTKYIFRKAMAPFLPREVIWRKDKQAFINPESEWLKHELKPRILEYFNEDSLVFKYKLVHRINILRKYQTYCRQPAGRGSIWFRDIFNPLALEIWLRKFEGYLR